MLAQSEHFAQNFEREIANLLSDPRPRINRSKLLTLDEVNQRAQTTLNRYREKQSKRDSVMRGGCSEMEWDLEGSSRAVLREKVERIGQTMTHRDRAKLVMKILRSEQHTKQNSQK